MTRPIIALFVLLSLNAAPATALSRQPSARVLVLANEAGPMLIEADGAPRATDPRVTAILARHAITRARVLCAGPRAVAEAPTRFLALTSSRHDFDPVAAAAELRATGAFRAVAPDVHLRLSTTTPDDIYLPYQWYVDSPGADIHLTDAWDVERGSPAVVIGIMDTGVDTSHPDLASQIWTNPGEIPGNGLDDDANGYLDDVHGWDFGNADNDPNPHAVYDSTGIDAGFHGTFVAGIAAAATNNGDGIAGAGWNCRILPLKVVDTAGDITLSAVTEAFGYAGRMGVDVLNMSFGGRGEPGVPEYFQALVDAATEKGVVCVAAAGNDTSDVPVYPAACDNVLSVAATDASDARAEFSNFGPWVDVAAPGAAMWSSICRNYTFNLINQFLYIFAFGWDGVNPYMYGDGTSFASPLAAGVCALVRSHQPSWTPGTVIHHVMATGDTVVYDQPIGLKLNAFRAVSDAVTGVPRIAAGGPEFGRAFPNPFVTATTLSFTLASDGPARLSIYDCAGRRVSDLVNGVLGAGPHSVRWDGAGAGGATAGSGIFFARLEAGGRALTRRLVRLR